MDDSQSILMENCSEYPHQNNPAVMKVWHMGLHPTECRGKCDMYHRGKSISCFHCRWTDEFPSPEAPALIEPKKTKVYISGKITGIENEAPALFAKAEAKLKEKGYDVVNPLSLNHDHDKSWHSYMRQDVKALCDCDVIYMLSNWCESKGARIEYDIANYLGISIMFQIGLKQFH